MNEANTHLMPWLTEKFISASPLAACRAVESLATHEALLLLKPLKAEAIISCLNPMDSAKAAAILRRLPSRQAAYILSRLEIQQAGRIFHAFSVPQQEKMKALLPAHFLKALLQSGAWPENSAGARMNRNFVSFRTEQKVADIIDKLKTWPRKKLPLACVIVSKDNKVKGILRTAELAFFPAEAVAGSVMSEAQCLQAAVLSTQAAPILQQGQPVVPVAGQEGELLGILTAEDLADKQSRKKRFGWF